jgi:hypothetical protein
MHVITDGTNRRRIFRMKRTIALGVAALVALAAPAAAQAKRAEVYKAKLAPTAAAAEAGVGDVKGKAHLVDGKKRDKASVHVRKLTAGETYLWHVHQATGEGDPCDPEVGVGNPAPYPGFEYRELLAGDSGNANSKGKSTAFPSETEDTGGDYYVNVHLGDGTVIACGVLKDKATRKAERKARREERRAAKQEAKSKGHEEPEAAEED